MKEVYLHNDEIPNGCYHCDFRENGHCKAQEVGDGEYVRCHQSKNLMNGNKPKSCPIKSVEEFVATLKKGLDEWRTSDVSKEQSSINYYCEMREWKDKYKEAEHRAMIAERALKKLAYTCLEIQGYQKEEIPTLVGEIVVPDYLKQAEKELSEEMK